jgi:hypothetical protein
MWFLVKGFVVETINIHVHVTGMIIEHVSFDLQDIHKLIVIMTMTTSILVFEILVF